MMIGKRIRRGSLRIWMATSKPSMRGISMSSSIRSGVCSSRMARASMPSLAVSTFMPLRSSRRLVTLRTVTESSTTSTSSGRFFSGSLRISGASTAWAGKAGCRARMCASRSMISTTWPSPRMVAPVTPCTPENCGPRPLTTISRVTGHGIHMHRHAAFIAVHQQHRHRLVLAQQFRAAGGVQQVA